MEDLKFIGKDKVPVVGEINTLDELKRLFSSHFNKFGEETPYVYKTIPLVSESYTTYARYYRGHSHVDYCLQSTLERYLEKFGNQIDIGKDYEKLQEKYFEHCKRILINQSIDGYVFHRLSKMLISSKLRKDVLAYLASINIDASTIYPDLLGKIKSCEIGIDNAIAEINLEYQD
ncbi:hypothetical protein MY776_06160 [Haemophilus influenzae]|uniref:hypothetical protein n=1 Tax=Haemophilus influenzae TaxID=727 RepID=UPI000E345C86|nr:hypothetical protein [Haemophilus influenzae]MCK8932290.1 hypothetical protein [Haemophilus influenzae]RFO66478.1 hypothetical protein CH569_06835 [Haemophilus influenzae]RFO70768.1 hypothetical protein CH568_06825 [Haemophilus influenzae]